MLDEAKKSKEEMLSPLKGSSKSLKMSLGAKSISYEVEADCIRLFKEAKPVAEVFYVSYIVKNRSKKPRPITFVFNGGPGAASAYLHLGALGPKRVCFQKDGSCPPPPSSLVDNAESWLAFTDLVFVDPVGTGFSRPLPSEDESKAEGAKTKENKAFFALNKDLDSLGEFASRFLSHISGWERPVYLAGESYGGFRAAKLSKLMQEGFGIGLNGVILISPALEWYLLAGTDYDLNHWVGTFPTMALTAHAHGLCKAFSKKAKQKQVMRAAEEFAARRLAPWLVMGNSLPKKEQLEIASEMAELIGLSTEEILERDGRIPIRNFSRLLLKSSGQVCGLYDAAITGRDPFPDRAEYEGPDATLGGIERIF